MSSSDAGSASASGSNAPSGSASGSGGVVPNADDFDGGVAPARGDKLRKTNGAQKIPNWVTGLELGLNYKVKDDKEQDLDMVVLAFDENGGFVDAIEFGEKMLEDSVVHTGQNKSKNLVTEADDRETVQLFLNAIPESVATLAVCNVAGAAGESFATIDHVNLDTRLIKGKKRMSFCKVCCSCCPSPSCCVPKCCSECVDKSCGNCLAKIGQCKDSCGNALYKVWSCFTTPFVMAANACSKCKDSICSKCPGNPCKGCCPCGATSLAKKMKKLLPVIDVPAEGEHLGLVSMILWRQEGSWWKKDTCETLGSRTVRNRMPKRMNYFRPVQPSSFISLPDMPDVSWPAAPSMPQILPFPSETASGDEFEVTLKNCFEKDGKLFMYNGRRRKEVMDIAAGEEAELEVAQPGVSYTFRINGRNKWSKQFGEDDEGETFDIAPDTFMWDVQDIVKNIGCIAGSKKDVFLGPYIKEMQAKWAIKKAKARMVREEIEAAVEKYDDLAFQPGSPALTPESMTVIKEIAAIMLKNKEEDVMLIVEGQSPADGSAGASMAKRRADSVARQLKKDGCPADKIIKTSRNGASAGWAASFDAN